MMLLTVAEFLKAVQEDREKLENNSAPNGIAACRSCGIPLQETVTGNRPCDDGVVCSDCYFDAMGDELDRHPITALRVSRGT